MRLGKIALECNSSVGSHHIFPMICVCMLQLLYRTSSELRIAFLDELKEGLVRLLGLLIEDRVPRLVDRNNFDVLVMGLEVCEKHQPCGQISMVAGALTLDNRHATSALHVLLAMDAHYLQASLRRL